MTPRDPAQALLETLEGSLALLSEYKSSGSQADLEVAEPLPTLLEQCLSLTAQAPAPEPIRSVHHLACTGGTLICKMIAAMPNVTLLSEVDPLSHMTLPDGQSAPPFRPTDLIFAGRVALRPLEDDIVERVALAALEEMRRALAERGGMLCLRDHAHGQYNTRVEPQSRASLYDILRAHGPHRGIVTVRHPLDSLVSLRGNAWVHYEPDTLEAYALRYLAFLEDHDRLPVFRYEDFVAAPEAELERMCAALALPYAPGAEMLLPAVYLSGDSGRGSSGAIAPRPRRAIPEDLQRETAESAAYRALCDRLGYDL